MTLKWSYCFSLTFQKYCQNTSLHGWKYLIGKKCTKVERAIWWFVQILAISSAIYLFYVIYGNFLNSPIITTLENANYQIENVPFPAVAICDVNRISRMKALEFSENRSHAYNLRPENFSEYIRFFGRLYDYDEEDIEFIYEFNRMLDLNIKYMYNYTRFINFMLNLTPTISDNILQCMWKTEIVNCSKIFFVRRTRYGFCSTFNYIKPSDHVFIDSTIPKRNKSTSYQEIPGISMGLTVVVRSFVDDYFYPLEKIDGLKVLLYNVHDYPDTSNGALVESLVPLEREVFLQINPVTVKAVDALRKYPVKQRKCLFAEESNTAFDSYHYSYSDCLSECRMHSILDLCECIPFYFSVSTKLSFSTQLCTLADISCLNKYKEKWNTISPSVHNKYTKGLEAEIQNSIKCPHCLPECSFTKYRLFNQHTPLINNGNPMLQGYNLSEISLVHIYFDTDSTFLFKTDLYYYWYDIVSNFGGMYGVFIGFSLMSLIEFFYYFIYYFIKLLIKTKNEDI